MAIPGDSSGSSRADKVRLLSKSDFKIARTCDAKLFFRENGYPDAKEYDPYLRFLAEGGYMAEALAKATYGDGVQLEYGGNPVEESLVTLEHLGRDKVTIFEGTLLASRRMARADIIEKRGNSVRLIEVKAKSFDGDEHRLRLANGHPGVFWTRHKVPSISSDWREKLEDLTFQVLLLEEMLPHIKVKPIIALLDKSKRTAIDGIPSLFELVHRVDSAGRLQLVTARYTGDPALLARLDLMTEIDVSSEIEALRDEVRDAAEHFEEMLDAPLDDFLNGLERASKCSSCEYRGDELAPDGFSRCWGDLSNAKPHFLELYSVGTARGPQDTSLVDWMWKQNKSALVDVPIDSLKKKDGSIGPVAERQRRQIMYNKSDSVFVGSSLKNNIQALQWPAHFIDFETSRLALPSHSKMRPYGLVTFQWSCHTATHAGATPVHSEWLNTQNLWPNQTFAETLRAAIGDSGPVVTWSPFERATLEQIAADLAEFGQDTPDLIQWLKSVRPRIVDLHEWARSDFYHPAMGGSTSIKVVLDALWNSDPELRRQFERWTGQSAQGAGDPYSTLSSTFIEGHERTVRDGTGAMRAYDAMMYGPGAGDAETTARWSQLLKQYCHLDTLSMMLILEALATGSGIAVSTTRSDAKLQRWIDLIAELLTHRYGLTLAQLCARVPAYASGGAAESVARTFERDKDELRALGIPIETTQPGDPGDEPQRYRIDARDMYMPFLAVASVATDSAPASTGAGSPRLRPGYRSIPSLHLDPDELDAIVTGVQHAIAIGDPAISADAASALRKLAHDLPIDVALGKAHTGIEPAAERATAANMRLLGQALMRRKLVTFSYHSMTSNVTSLRAVEPYGVFFVSGHWYLAGRDPENRELRNFRVSRMRDVVVNTKRPQTTDYDVPSDFSLAEHAVDRSAWELGEGNAQEMVVHFTGTSGVVESALKLGRGNDWGKNFRTFRVKRVDVFARWILSFAGEAVPVSPPELVNEFRKCAQAVRAMYREYT